MHYMHLCFGVFIAHVLSTSTEQSKINIIRARNNDCEIVKFVRNNNADMQVKFRNVDLIVP
jgi:hypothetical protein